MKNKYLLNYDLELKKNISEITSISIDVDYEVVKNKVFGEFTIEGTYKSHGLSMNQDDFYKDIEFTQYIDEDGDPDTVTLEITNFEYVINANVICASIEYVINYNKMIKEYDDMEEFNRFLDQHEIEVINFDELERDVEELKPEIIEEIVLPQLDKIEPEKKLSLFDEEEHFITYHIYICNEYDTYDSISTKYNISIDKLKEYNESTELKLGTKLIIPLTDE